MPMWSVGSRELCQPRTEDDRKPVAESNLSLPAPAQRGIRSAADSASPIELWGARRSGLSARRPLIYRKARPPSVPLASDRLRCLLPIPWITVHLPVGLSEAVDLFMCQFVC